MNCLLYARVSTDKQAKKDLSIPAQVGIMKEYAQKNNWKVIGHYIDEGESARTADRPELKKLIQHCKDKKNVNIILIHKIDRLARNLVDYATIKAILKQKNIRIVSVSEPFDDNPVGHLLENIIASISEWYSSNLGEEVKKASFAKLKRGEWPHRPPIGYKSIKNENNRAKHIPDLKNSLLIKQAYELFSSGEYSLNGLSEEMAHRGLKTRYGRVYGPDLMKRILTRKFYMGVLEWKGKIYKGIHKPIISKNLFYRVEDVLEKRSIDTGEKGKYQYLLRGVSYCKICGQRLTAETHPRGIYYRCINNLHKKKCSQPYTPVSLLDSQLEAIYSHLQPPKKLLELLKLEMSDIAGKRKQIAGKELKILKKTIEDFENKEMKLLDEMLGGRVSRDIYEKMQKKYSEKKEAAEKRLSQFEVDYDDPLDFLDKCIVVSSMLLYLHKKFDFEHKKKLLRAIFEKINVKDKAIVDVKLNPPFSIFLGNKLEKLFKDRPLGAAQEDVFEQIVDFTLSEDYLITKRSIAFLTKEK